jgi:hypothetical protein
VNRIRHEVDELATKIATAAAELPSRAAGDLPHTIPVLDHARIMTAERPVA